jgi:farnesyl diphosphate synthase
LEGCGTTTDFIATNHTSTIGVLVVINKPFTMSSSVTIAAALMAVSFLPLASKWGEITDSFTTFFFGLELAEQLGFLGIIFSFVFLATSLSPSAGDSAVSTDFSSDIEYPVKEMEKAENDKERFEAVYPMLRDDMLEHMESHNLPEEAVEWVREMMDYTVPGGKLNRGTTVVSICELLNKTTDTVELAKSSVLGWAVEFLQAFFLVADDVMDDSPTRRGQPCWYKLEKVGLIAINDSFILESFVFSIIKKHFSGSPYYHQLVDLFLEITQNTEFGQLLDLTSQTPGKIDLTRFTLERYQMIVKYKTAFYTFYLPVAIGMITSGVKDKANYDLAKSICLKMGEYFQIQDDYLDCFGDPEVIGKVGTDIQDNKCSWLVVQALNLCSPGQRKVLEKNYGQWDDKKVAKIKALYHDLDLPKVFEDYEEASYARIQEDLQKVDCMPRECFDVLLKKIYKRSK